jgi:hypothetical protein
MDNFYKKYLKYKSKYLNLRNNSNSLKGGLEPVSFRKVYGGYYAITYEGTIRYYVRHTGLGRVGRDGINIQATFKIIKNFINPEEIGGSIGIIEGDTKYKFYEINEHELELSANELQHKIDDIIPSITAAVEAERIEQERRAAAVEAERAAAIEAERAAAPVMPPLVRLFAPTAAPVAAPVAEAEVKEARIAVTALIEAAFVGRKEADIAITKLFKELLAKGATAVAKAVIAELHKEVKANQQILDKLHKRLREQARLREEAEVEAEKKVAAGVADTPEVVEAKRKAAIELKADIQVNTNKLLKLGNANEKIEEQLGYALSIMAKK